MALPPVFAGNHIGDVRDQSEVFAQLRFFLAHVTQLQPAIVVLEDIHWADPVSLELVRALACHLEHLPLCLVLTYRVEEVTRQQPLYRHLPGLIRESNGVRIDLSGLGLDDLMALAANRYGLPGEDCERLARFLLQHADGNPFFSLEILRALEQPGGGQVLHRGEAGWTLGPLEPIEVPPLIRQVIDLRLDRMPATVQDALALAAVIGKDIDLEIWQRLLGAGDEAMLAMLESAVESHIVEIETPGERARFVHALTRDALYGRILPRRRRQLPRGAEIDHRGEVLAGEDLEVVVGQRGQRIGAVEAAGADDGAGCGGQLAEIADVERGLEADRAVGQSGHGRPPLRCMSGMCSIAAG